MTASLNPKLRTLLAEIHESGRENDERETDRKRKMLNLDPETAAMIHILVRASGRKRILEIGTSNGYSTIWLADAARSAGAGQVASIDRNPAKVKLAKENLTRAGLMDFVTLYEGEASAIVRELPGPFDCVFFDADRFSAPGQLEMLLPKLQPDVLLLADNVLSHPAEIAGYLNAVNQSNGFSSVVVPIGKGLHIAYRQASRA